MKNSILILFILFSTLLGSAGVKAQVVDYETRITVLMDNDWEVTLFGEAIKNKLPTLNKSLTKAQLDSLPTPAVVKDGKYYYVPPSQSLRISSTSKGEPEFLFMKFTGNKPDAATGGILHFLLQYGLTREQEAKVQDILREKLNNPGLKIMGSLPMLPLPGEDSGTFEVISATAKSEKLGMSFEKSRAPTGQSDKAAVATVLTDYGSTIMEKSLTDGNISDISVKLNYTYPIRVQAASGRLKFNSFKFNSSFESYSKTSDYKRKDGFMWGLFGGGSESLTVDETRSAYDYAMEREIITLEFSEGLGGDPEVMETVRSAFFNFFLKDFTTPGETPAMRPGLTQDSVAMSKRRQSYNINMTDYQSSTEDRKREMKLDYRVTINWPHAFTANLQTWNGDKKLADYIQEVNLYDPFYTRRIISVAPGADVQGLLGTEINSLEVQLRVRHSGGTYAFGDQDPIVFRKSDASVQNRAFAPMGGKGVQTDKLEYRTRISFKDGAKKETPWEAGDWSAIDVSVGLLQKEIKFEADLNQLSESKIIRAILQVRYLKYGKESTDELSLRPATGDIETTKEIFLDNNGEGYATRVIYHRRTGAPVVMPWKPSQSDFHNAYLPESWGQETGEKIDDFLSKHKVPVREVRDILGATGILKATIAAEGAGLIGEDD